MPITLPYLLAVGLPCYIDKNGHRYFEWLWVKDLIEHLKYIDKLSLASPVIYGDPPEGYVDLASVKEFDAVKFIDLPRSTGLLDAIKNIPFMTRIFWRAVRSNEIIHTGIAGWPLPYGWILTPMAKFSNKFLVIIVESAFWRITPGVEASRKAKLRAGITELFGRWCVNSADLPMFTQEEYKTSLLTNKKSEGYVDPASWIDEDKVVSRQEAEFIWSEKKLSGDSRLKVVFVGRLNSKKGIDVLLAAINLLELKKIPVDLDILGEGELLDKCVKASEQARSYTKLRVLGVLPYTEVFYQFLRAYHLIIVPTISDEQPRIIFDAFSQALPVFASNTNGNRGCVRPMNTGILFEPNNAVALGESLEWALHHADEVSSIGLSAAEEASRMTHTAMHRRRWALLSKLTTARAVKPNLA